MPTADYVLICLPPAYTDSAAQHLIPSNGCLVVKCLDEESVNWRNRSTKKRGDCGDLAALD
jgi:hypothetical protein